MKERKQKGSNTPKKRKLCRQQYKYCIGFNSILASIQHDPTLVNFLVLKNAIFLKLLK